MGAGTSESRGQELLHREVRPDWANLEVLFGDDSVALAIGGGDSVLPGERYEALGGLVPDEEGVVEARVGLGAAGQEWIHVAVAAAGWDAVEGRIAGFHGVQIFVEELRLALGLEVATVGLVELGEGVVEEDVAREGLLKREVESAGAGEEGAAGPIGAVVLAKEVGAAYSGVGGAVVVGNAKFSDGVGGEEESDAEWIEEQSDGEEEWHHHFHAEVWLLRPETLLS